MRFEPSLNIPAGPGGKVIFTEYDNTRYSEEDILSCVHEQSPRPFDPKSWIAPVQRLFAATAKRNGYITQSVVGRKVN